MYYDDTLGALGEDCESYARTAETFERLSQKKDKSAATRASAAQQADDWRRRYQNCLNAQAMTAAGVTPLVAAQPPQVVSQPPVQAYTQPPIMPIGGPQPLPPQGPAPKKTFLGMNLQTVLIVGAVGFAAYWFFIRKKKG